MPQRLAPRKERRRNRLYWVVSLGSRFTGAQRERHYFRSRKEANEFTQQAEKARLKQGYEAFDLPLSIRSEAAACSKRLKALNCTLTEAVEFFIRHRPRPEAAKPLEVLKNEFLKARKAMNCRPRTLLQYESYLRVICAEFGDTDVAQIIRQDMEDWIEESEWSPRTRKNYLVTLTTILNFAVAKGYRADNPAAGIDRPILDDRPVGILEVKEARALLRVSKSLDPDMAPSLAVALFAGLRRSEFFALDWSEVDLEGRTIEVKGIKAKTRQRRLVHIVDNLLEWLTPFHKKHGRLAPEKNIDVFSERIRALVKVAGIHPWPHNAMRHSFGSYFLGKTKDEKLTASEMGNSPEVVIRHYRAIVKDAAIAEYWALTPTTLD